MKEEEKKMRREAGEKEGAEQNEHSSGPKVWRLRF